MKKIMSLVLAVTLLMSVFGGLTAFAADAASIPEGYKAKIKATDDVVSVRVAGLQSQVNALNVTELYGTVDVAAFFAAAGEEIELEEGTYYPRTTCTLPEYVYVKEGGTVQLVLEEE